MTPAHEPSARVREGLHRLPLGLADDLLEYGLDVDDVYDCLDELDGTLPRRHEPSPSDKAALEAAERLETAVAHLEQTVGKYASRPTEWVVSLNLTADPHHDPAALSLADLRAVVDGHRRLHGQADLREQAHDELADLYSRAHARAEKAEADRDVYRRQAMIAQALADQSVRQAERLRGLLEAAGVAD